MPLKGEARTKYIREYMRKRRAAERATKTTNKEDSKPHVDVARLQAEIAALKAENAALRSAKHERASATTVPKSGNEQIDRLRALWKSGRDKYQSFFKVLHEVQQEIGDEAMATWCFNNLHVGLDAMEKASGALLKTDRDMVMADLKAAKRAGDKSAR